MRHISEGAELILEEVDLQGAEVGQDLERDVLPRGPVEGLPDRAHAARADDPAPLEAIPNV